MKLDGFTIISIVAWFGVISIIPILVIAYDILP